MAPDIYSQLIEAAANSGRFAAQQDTEMDPKNLSSLWQVLCEIKNFADLSALLEKARKAKYGGAIPSLEPIDKAYLPDSNSFPCIGVDGSQIYPSKSSSVPFAWITALGYKTNSGIVCQLSECLTEDLWDLVEDENVHKNFVDIRRSLLEMKTLKEACCKYGGSNVIIHDGSLLPWFSPGAISRDLSKKVVTEYIELLEQCCPNPIASVTSGPRSRAIINLISLMQSNSVDGYTPVRSGPRDKDLVLYSIGDHERTALFLNNSLPNEQFHQKGIETFFFYLRMGNEVSRVEIPKWVANAPNLVSLVHASILKDSRGLNTPYTLSQAHYQVVVKADLADAIRKQADLAFLNAGGKIPSKSAKENIKGIE